MFIDDILIYSKYDEECVEHLRVLLQTLKEKKLYAKLSKCKVWLWEVNFLGHMISIGGIAIVFTVKFGKQNKFILILKGSNSKISRNIFVWI